MRGLVLKELLEILVPSVYCLTFVGSYYGPNFEIMGSLGSDVWHHEKVGSLNKKLENILMLMGLESLRGLTFALVLWMMFRINAYSAYGYVIHNYGWTLFWVGTYVNTMVSNKYQKE